KLRERCAQQPVAPPMQPYIDQDIAAVAQVLLNAPLEALGKRALRELVPSRTADATTVESLARYFASGFMAPNAQTIAWRLVPPAAALALEMRLEKANPQSPDAAIDALTRLYQTFTQNITIPKWLSTPPASALDLADAAARRLARALKV